MDLEEKNVLKLIKARGYKVTSDNLGMYFDFKNTKFSIIKVGNIYNCYHNEKPDDGSAYVLQDSYNSQILLKQCLFWILNKINKPQN